MNIDERELMRKLFAGTLYVIKLNHVNNLLKNLDPARVTMEKRGLLRAQYTHVKPKYDFAVVGGRVKVLMTSAGVIPVAFQIQPDGSSLIIFNSKDKKKLITDYAEDLNRLAVPLNEDVKDDPRTELGAARFGSGRQVSDAEVQFGNKLISMLLSDNKKSIMETEAYKSLMGIVPLEKLMAKKAQRGF